MTSPLVEFQEIQRKGQVDIAKVIDLGGRLAAGGFHAQSEACLNAAVNVLHSVIAQGNADQALAIENALYTPFIKSTETEENYYKCFSRWTAQLQALGRKHHKPFPQPGDPRKICFVLQTGVVLGHTEVLFRVVDSWRAQGIDAELYVAVMGQSNPDFKDEIGKRGIRYFQAQEKTLAAALGVIRDAISANGIHTAVWLGPPVLMSYALAMRLGPRQVNWSVKFHPVWVPEVDVHICGGHESEVTRKYNGHDWTVAPFPLTLATKRNAPEAVAAIRNKFPADAVLLGVLAREEKLNSAPYMEAVCTLLKRNPKAVFLWAGRSQPEYILGPLRKAGVLDRAHFIGWVDTNLYAEVIDIFLETYPFGCGITGFQAISHGTPLLSKVDADTLYGLQLQAAVAQKFKGAPPSRADFEALPLLTAESDAHYVELAQRLIDDKTFRAEIGERGRQYFQDELDALPRYSKRLWDNISGLK